MGLNHFILFFFLGLVQFSLGKRCLGCPKNIDIHDQELHDYLSKKLHDLKGVIPKGTVTETELELVRVKNAQEQVVSGIQYSYQFEAIGLNSNQMYDCSLKVLRQPWLGPDKITEYSCNLLISNANRRLLPGGEIIIDVHKDNELEELKSFISQEIGKVQHSEYLMIVMQYLKATKQVVEGILIKTTVQIGITNCHLKLNSADADCQHKLQGHQVCDVQVWLKPWMKFKQVTVVQCQPLQSNYFEKCAGCPIEKDPNSAFIKQSLEKTLYKLNKESHTSQKLSLVKINKATSQVINGIKLTVYFDAQDAKSHRKYTCKAVIILPPSSSEEQIEDEFNCTPVSAY
ncbi:unnamed protein product [Nezara viridula]|uniref:Cystatin domain-containing protein n=1 Tax=Nezara viridula TaxID=85310 RepID=A0A9P0E2M9_NEZVI|nr:unnamed protein product [Nezara viridula]